MTRKQQTEKRRRGTQEDTARFGYYVVCLIDVLGQKQKLTQWADLPEDGQITPDFLAAVKQTVGTVLTFREHFVSHFKMLGQCTMPEKLAALPKAQQEAYHRFRNCEVRVERFSDTFVFSSPILNKHGDESIAPMYNVLEACCFAMLLSLAGKAPIRGAVTVGAGLDLPDGSFYGPALAEAHQLESEVAAYPRVIVSPTARGFLARGQVYSTDPRIAQMSNTIAEICRSMIWQDVDGCLAVDFLGKGMRELVGPDTKLPDAVKAAYQFVCEQAEQFRIAGNAKLAVRYDQLRQYMESRLHLWDVERNA